LYHNGDTEGTVFVRQHYFAAVFVHLFGFYLVSNHNKNSVKANAFTFSKFERSAIYAIE